MGRALTKLLRQKYAEFPFTVTGIHTLRHGTAVDAGGLLADVCDAPPFGPRMASIEEFLDASGADAAVELTTLIPPTGSRPSRISARRSRGACMW